MRNSNLPGWRIEQAQRLALASAHIDFANNIRSEMREKGWRYDPCNNEFTKGSFCLYFSSGMGIFTQSSCDGTLPKICHRFDIFPENMHIGSAIFRKLMKKSNARR